MAAVERMTGNLTALANLGQAVPAAAAALDKVDFDATVDVIVEGLGVPLKVIRDEDQLAAFREQRAQQQAQAQQAAQAQQMQTMAAETAMQRSVKAA